MTAAAALPERHSGLPIDAALAYAAAGYPVFPLRERGKTPITPHGHLDATRDPGRIRQYWQVCPTANIGLAVPAGLVVVDVDDPDALLRLKAEDRDLPATAKSTTGRGLHLYYRCDRKIRNSVGLFPGVDLRSQGGYVVVPPSVHPTGARYRWEVPLRSANIADAPDWLLKVVAETQTPRARPPEEWRQLTGKGVEKGKRNKAIASLAGHLLRHEVDPFVTLNLLLPWNAACCRPPLSDREVERTVDSIAGCELRRREKLA